jgi:excisionase family DNA binding protein
MEEKRVLCPFKLDHLKEIKVEAIVSDELWEKANNFLGQKQTKTPFHLFVGFVFCDCGGKMIVPSSSDKYVCLECKKKIGSDDLEEVFASQLTNVENNLSESWEVLTQKEKRIIIEQITNKIIIARTEISIEFSYQPNISSDIFKTPTLWQQNQRGNESPKSEATEATKPNQNEPSMNEVEAAKFLGISRMTLLRKRNAGEIGFYRVGFRVLYSKEKHLIPFLEQCEK